MQHNFQERWFQEIAESAKLSPLSPEVINTLVPIVELHIRKIIQNAHKHQRHSKSRTLKGKTLLFSTLL
jgi:histone H3/H4